MAAVTVPTGPAVVPRWIDNHCHLDGEDDPRSVVDEARVAGVRALITVGTDVRRSRACLELADGIDGVWATAGVHPHDAPGGGGGLLPPVLGRPPRSRPPASPPPATGPPAPPFRPTGTWPFRSRSVS